MADDSRQTVSNLFTQLDISPSGSADKESADASENTAQTVVLQQILTALDRQNELLEELVTQQGAAQRQRQNELEQWRQANPELASRCRQAAETLSRVQAEFLETLATEVEETSDGLMDGEFLLAEFVDRFGPRLAHLNGVLQVLSQLAAQPHPAKGAQS